MSKLPENARIPRRICSPLHAALGQKTTQCHTSGLRSVFSHAHVLGKYMILIYFPAHRRENSAEGFLFPIRKDVS